MANWFTQLFSNPDTKQVTANSAKTNVVITSVAPKRVWRNNMWVMTPNGVGIIFELAEPVTVHLVNTSTGETIRSALYASRDLRQAKYQEIPECRRCAVDKAFELGYE